MRMNFKRTFSGLLAFILMLSSLVVVNTASVSAADHKIESNTFNAADYADDNVSNNDTFSGIFNFTVGASLKTFDTPVNGYTHYVVVKDGVEIKFQTSGANATLTVFATAGNKKSKIDGVEQTGQTFSNEGNERTYTIAEKGSHSFCFSGGGGNLAYLKLEDAGIGKDLTWTVEKSGSSLRGTLTAGAVSGKDYAILTYTTADDSDNYELLPTKRVITTSTVGVTQGETDGAYIFTITDDGSAGTAKVDDYFIQSAKIPYSAINIENGGNRVLHLACQEHRGDVISVKMNAKGDAVLGTIYSDTDNGGYGIDTESSVLPLHVGTYTATMTGGTLKESAVGEEKTEFVVDDNNSKFEAYFVADELKDVDTNTTSEIKFNSIKVSDAAAAERLMGGTVIGGGYFRVLGADYSDDGVYALRQTPGGNKPESSENGKAFAVVLRCNDADDTGNNYGSAIGFKIADTKDTEGKEFSLELQCQAVADIESTGDDATIGLMKIDEENDAKIEDVNSYVGITHSEVENVTDTTPITFTHLQPGVAYGIYNPGKADKNGNIRIYSAKFTASDATPETEKSNIYVYLNDPATDAPKNNLEVSDCNDPDVFVTMPGGNSSDIGSTQYLDIGSKKYTVTRRSGNVSSTTSLKIKVPEGVSDATLYVLTAYQGGGTRYITVAKVGGSTVGTIDSKGIADGDNTTPWDTGSVSGLSTGEYTLTPNNGVRIAAMALVTGPAEPEKASISGDITYTKNYSVRTDEYENSDLVTDKDPKANVTVDTAKVTSKPKATVTITGVGNDFTETINVSEGTGTYSCDNKGAGLEPGQYKVNVKIDGMTAKEETVTVEAEKATVQNFDFAAPTYDVDLQTNIKDYRQEITVYDGDTKIFTLSDKTYHHGSTSGVVAKKESVTHMVNMPAGTYTLQIASNDTYKLSTSSVAVSPRSSSRAQTRDIIITSATDVNYETLETLWSGASMGSDYVSRGTYRFVRSNADANTSSVARSEYSIGNARDEDGKAKDGKGIYAKGIYQPSKTTNVDPYTQYTGGTNYYGENEGRIGLYSGSSTPEGYVLFQIGEGDNFLTRINVSNKPCMLCNLDENTSQLIDSSYSEATIMLGKGRYALISTAASDSPANATTITFDVASPFKVIADNIQDYNDDSVSNAKLIIGTYEDTIAGTSDLNDFDKFAIFISNNKDMLNYDHINNIVKASGDYTDNDVSTNNDYVTKSAEATDDNGVVPSVIEMTNDSGANIIRDETNTVFEKIVLDSENIDKGSDTYVYATILEGAGTYYAVGGALSAASGGDGQYKWLIQEEEAAEITIN